MGSFRIFSKARTTACIFHLIFIFALFASANKVYAGTISLNPSSGTYSVGSIISAHIIASSPNQAINAVSGTLKFPSDKLQVVSLSKANTIMSLWVQEPSYSNIQGTVDFAGVVLNPGFIGSGGQVLTVSFKVIAMGSAKISFTAGSELANDGNGTEVISGLNGAQYTLTAAVEVPKVETPSPVPVAPIPTPPVDLDAPTIQKYTDAVLSTDTIFVQGVTQPNFTARMYVENPGNRVKVAESHSDDKGNFTITWDQQSAGLEKPTIYYVRIDAVSLDGNKVTKLTNTLPITVRRTLPQSSLLLIALIICIIAIVILIVALFLVVYKRKEHSSRGGVKEEVKKAENLVRNTFGDLKKNLDYYTEVVETTAPEHQLSKAEEVIVKRMERNLDEAEEAIQSEVQNIGEKADEQAGK